MKIVSQIPDTVFGVEVEALEGPWSLTRVKRYGKRFKLAMGRVGYPSYIVQGEFFRISFRPWFDAMSGRFMGWRRYIVHR